MDTSLTLRTLDSAKGLIEKASTSQLKEIISRAEALRVYAMQAKKGLEIQNQCAEIKLRAERRIGEQLKQEVKAGNPQLSKATTIGLTELGISRDDSSKWQAVASLPEKDFERHMAEVQKSNEELTTIGVIRLARELRGVAEKKNAPPLPKGKYAVIYADPPWLYGRDQHGKEEQDTVLSSHYPSMPTEDICQLPIGKLAGDNSVLFLWTTSPKLFEAKAVIEAWGFEYKTSMVWDKVKHNVGYYVSVRHEFLLICTKGSCLPDSKKLHDSVVTLERSNRHSEKPEKFYEIIDEMYKGKKIELFSRKKRKGWEAWGNE